MKFCILQSRTWNYIWRLASHQLLLAVMLPSFAFSGEGPKGQPELRAVNILEKNISGRQIIVSGQVTDESGEPLPGVSVIERGSKNSTVTDVNGTFRISVSDDNAQLVFSFIGFESSTVSVAGRTNINLSLKPASNLLSELVVSVGYGTQRKSDLTGSVSSINMNDTRSLPVPDVGQAIQGKAAGVQVVSSGAPGSNVEFRIRGVGTINNSNPLLVIDGVPSDIPLNAINAADIESIEVLKDASAAAIYGSRGANGVVLITTKRGKAGKSSLEFRAFTGVQSATNMVEMLNASQFAALHNEIMLNNGNAANPAYADPSSFGAGTDWLNALFSSAPMQNYSVSYSGGNEKSTYYVSGGVMDQKGIVLNTNYRRYTLQANTNSKVFDWLSFGNNLTFSHDQKGSGAYDIRNAMAALPVQPIYNPDGSYAGPVGQSAWYGDIANPIGKATINTNRTNGYNLLGNIFGEITVMKGLTFKSTGGVQASFWDDRSWSPKYDFQPIPQPNSSLFHQYNKNITWLWDNFFTYNKEYSSHRLNFVAGSSAQSNRYNFMNGSIQQFASDATQQLSNGTAQPTVGGSASEWALLSFLARANYSYADKYLFTATVRRDGSSRFGANNRWGTFPSGSFAYRLSNEDFFKENFKAISNLKLRLGYGITGNQNIGNYSFASVLQTVQYNFNGQPVTAIVPLAIPNPTVRWEEVEQFNAGLDMGLFNNRINLTADAYLKNTNDMLVPMAVPISTGYSDIVVPSINAGKVQNRGVEFTIDSRNTTGAFEWNTNLNMTFNRNEVISLNSDVPMYTGGIGLNQNLAIHKPGYPVNSFYGFVGNGIFQTQTDVDAYAVQVPGADPFNRTSAGDMRFKDVNSDGKIDDSDRTFLGNPNPTMYFGMNNNFSFKGLDLSVFFQGVSGNDIYNANRISLEGMAVAQNQTTAVLKRWNGEGTSNTMPRAVFNDPNKNTRVSNRFIEDGSYVRLKNVTLGYTLPKSLSQKAKLTTARIYLSGQNLLTITNYSGFDPEVGVNGIDLSVYPVTRTLSAGINLTF